MTTESLKETIKRELPTWLREDPAFRSYVLELTRDEYADRRETGDRFYELLGELRRDREKQERKWEENQAELERTRGEQAQKWEENQAELKRMREEEAQKWEENQAELKRMREEEAQKWEANQAELQRMREEEAQKWEANQAELQCMREEQAQKWEQQNRRWDENQAERRRLWDENRAEQRRLWEESRADSNRRWDENQEELKRLHNEIMAQAQKFDRGIGALGSRWGLQSEKAFRDALAAILEQSFDVQVVNVTDYDDSGEVFGRPDQIELDVIIKNGLLLICELKSSIDKAGMYIFERKARFYERRHERKANRLIVVSPMIDSRARKVGERLGIEMYGDSTEVEAV
jgi:hypothetical protein